MMISLARYLTLSCESMIPLEHCLYAPMHVLLECIAMVRTVPGTTPGVVSGRSEDSE